MVELPAALLVLAECVLSLRTDECICGVMCCTKPLIWSDELAGILFLWLPCWASVVALRRGEHMRMTAIVGALAEVAGVSGSRCHCRLHCLSGTEVAEPAFLPAGEVWVTTPALEIVNSWRASALRSDSS